MKIKRLDKLPKRKVTIDELLELSDIQDILNDISEAKSDIEEIVVIYTSGKNVHWIANGLLLSRILWLIETVKQGLLTEQ
jgi:hypothetical protein